MVEAMLPRKKRVKGRRCEQQRRGERQAAPMGTEDTRGIV